MYERDLLRQQNYSEDEINAIMKRRAEEKAEKDSETKAGTAAQAAEQAVEEKEKSPQEKIEEKKRSLLRKRWEEAEQRKVKKILEEERIAAEEAARPRVKVPSLGEVGLETIEETKGLRKGGYIRRAKRVRRKRRR